MDADYNMDDNIFDTGTYDNSVLSTFKEKITFLSNFEKKLLHKIYSIKIVTIKKNMAFKMNNQMNCWYTIRSRLKNIGENK